MSSAPNRENGGRPRILVSNDDGYRADGLQALVKALSSWAEVFVVAPDRERSGSGHAITLDRPLRLRPLDHARGPGAWHLVDGTPTDCVNLGLHVLFADTPPDLVVSGINHGVNLGSDVSYSGTVGGALEACNYDVPAVALSQRTDGAFDFDETAEVASSLVQGLVEVAERQPGEAPTLLNVNFPTGPLGDFVVTRLGKRSYRDAVATRNDPRGREYYWISGSPDWSGGEGTDVDAIQRGLISVTPLTDDMTARDELEQARRTLEAARSPRRAGSRASSED